LLFIFFALVLPLILLFISKKNPGSQRHTGVRVHTQCVVTVVICEPLQALNDVFHHLFGIC